MTNRRAEFLRAPWSRWLLGEAGCPRARRPPSRQLAVAVGEPFRASGRERALAPDALIDLDDKDGRQLLAFVELDLGTMIRPRLRVKAAGYPAYVYERAWAQRHPFCPALLFLTTGEARALAFLQAACEQLERLGRGRWRGWSLRSGQARPATSSSGTW